MKAKMTPSSLANSILEKLCGRYYYTSTSNLRLGLDLNVSEQAYMREVLDKLYRKGIIERIGDGKYKWRFPYKEWNRDFPFDPIEDKNLQSWGNVPPPPVTYSNSDADDDDKTGDDNEKPKPQSFPPAHVAMPQKNYDAVIKNLHEELITTKNTFGTMLSNMVSALASMEVQLKEAKAQANASVKVVRIEKDGQVVKKIKDKVLPAVYDQVLDLAICRRNILLVGPAGCGKSYLAKLVADSLGLPFGSISLTSGMSESHLLGRKLYNFSDGTSEYEESEFVTLYENGGLFLADELDAGDPNLLLAINTALANGYLNIPNRTGNAKAIKHKDFVIIATANTFGRGATRIYSGRNQLDEATIDRFRIGTVDCYYDPIIEESLCPDEELRTTCQYVRKKIEENGLRRVMSTRFMEDAYVMKAKRAWSVSKIMETFYNGWSEDERGKADYRKIILPASNKETESKGDM